MFQRFTKVLKSQVSALTGKPLLGQGEFSKRIQHRHRTFWEFTDGRKLQRKLISAKDPIQVIKDVEHWQRKLSNKYNSREFAAKLGCRVPELYWKGRDVATIDFTQLPKQFVIRPTIGHSCNQVFLMNDSFNLMDKRFYSNKELSLIMAEALAQNSYLEFLIEEFIRSEDGEYKIPKDYKFYTFNGEIARIEVINRLGPNEGSTGLYTANWEQVENLSSKYAKAPYEKPPKCFNELATYAKELSKVYEIFVRIDFYATDKGAVFGEFTPTPALGKVFTSRAEEVFIRYWDQHCKNMI